MALTPSQRKSNLRLALVLASVAAMFFFGIVIKMLVLSS